jgi:predicted DNA-binding transcriptional regulator AlpA
MGQAASAEKLITKHELAELARQSVRNLNRLLAKGDLPKPDVRLGRKSLWRPRTIERWLEAGGKRS